MTQPDRTIFVTLQKEGIHFYPQAATDPALADVSFLGHPHRHMFHIKASLEVFHDDRDLEFILVKRALTKYIDEDFELNHMSCEMISDGIAKFLQNRYPNRWIGIEVSEDGENGSYCVYPTTLQKYTQFKVDGA